MYLADLAREVQRIVSDMTDAEIQMLIDAAVAEMRRVGIRGELLDPENMSALAKYAVIMHVKATYGHDDSERSFWWQLYQHQLAALMNSSANECDTIAQDESLGSTVGDDAP